MHKNLVKIGRAVPEILYAPDRPTKRQTDTVIKQLRLPYWGRSNNTFTLIRCGLSKVVPTLQLLATPDDETKGKTALMIMTVLSLYHILSLLCTLSETFPRKLPYHFPVITTINYNGA